MNHAKIIIGAALASLILTGCASSGDVTEATEASYKAALADAKMSIQIAAKAHYEWRDTGKILKKADKAAKAGDFVTATNLAMRARRQGELAFTQAEQQKNAGPQQ